MEDGSEKDVRRPRGGGTPPPPKALRGGGGGYIMPTPRRRVAPASGGGGLTIPVAFGTPPPADYARGVRGVQRARRERGEDSGCWRGAHDVEDLTLSEIRYLSIHFGRINKRMTRGCRRATIESFTPSDRKAVNGRRFTSVRLLTLRTVTL